MTNKSFSYSESYSIRLGTLEVTAGVPEIIKFYLEHFHISDIIK